MTTRRTFARVTTALATAACFTAAATAGTVSWSFDETTSGDDVFWTSPTDVDNTAPRYDIAYEITQVEVVVLWLIFEIPVDVTDQISPELQIGSAIVDGPPPITIIQDSIVYPAPPEPPGITADIDLQIDAAGFGQLSVTNVFLGELTVDLGPPFGVQTVQLLSVRVAGNVTVTPLGHAGDVTGDGVVNFDDLLLVLSNWGPCPAPPEACPGDTDGDGIVGFSDLLQVLSDWS